MLEQDPSSQGHFYHLRLELYPSLGAVSTDFANFASDNGLPTVKTGKTKKKGKERAQNLDGTVIWTPTAGTDIFGSLPGELQPTGLRTSLQQTRIRGQNSSKPSEAQRAGQSRLESASSLPQERKAQIGSPKSAVLSKLPQSQDDWRFDSIRIDSLDMAPAGLQPGNLSQVTNSASQSNSKRIPGAGSKPQETRARFETLRAENVGLRTTEVGWGVVHLYREGEETQPISSLTSRGGLIHAHDDEDTTILCIPAVPSYMTPSDFLGWAGEKTIDQVSNVRFIVTGQLNRYLVLMKFRDGAAARVWKREWDGKVFAGMEPENCHVMFVRSIIFDCPPTAGFSDTSHDPFVSNLAPTVSNDATTALDSRPFPPPTPSLLELPTCPVCLERMDSSITGLLTILCAHSFHCTCLQKWRGSGCPVCRHVQPSSSLNLTRPFGSSEISHDFCSVCDTQDDLWICLICGNVGCGRYKGGHAKEHWKEEAHCFALEIETQHVWDYAGDAWVHRLISTKGDGKVVELPGARARQDGDDGIDMVPRSKLDGMGMEYTQLLISQLESQRIYFEEQVKKAVDKATSASTIAEASARESLTAAEAVRGLQSDLSILKSERDSLEKERDRLKVRAERSAEVARKMTVSFQEEKQVSKGLMDRIGHVNEAMAKHTNELTKLKAEVEDLKEQNRDLSFFISSQEKLAKVEGELGDEIREGSLSLPAGAERREDGGGSGGKKKGKGRKT